MATEITPSGTSTRASTTTVEPTSGSTSASTRGSSSAGRVANISYARFDLTQDDPAALSWADTKRMARKFGIQVINTMTWEVLIPKLDRRLAAYRSMIKKYESPSKTDAEAEAARQNRKAIDEIMQRKRKREQEAEEDRKALDNLRREPIELTLGTSARSDSSIGVRNISSELNEASEHRTKKGRLYPISIVPISPSKHTPVEEEPIRGSAIPSYIKRGKGREGRKTKEGKKLFESMKTELQISRPEMIPLQIAEALFDFNIKQLIKFAIILVPSVQRKYSEKRQEYKPTRRNNQMDLLASILDEKIMEDPIADTLMSENDVCGIMMVASVVKDYVVPLVNVAWDPILETPLGPKLHEFIVDVEADEIVDIEGWRIILDRTWSELSLKAMGVAHNFVAVRKIMSEVNLKEMFEKRKTMLLYQRVRNIGSGRVITQGKNDGTGARNANTGKQGYPNNRKPDNRDDAYKARNEALEKLREARNGVFVKLREIFGEDTQFDRSFWEKWEKSKHGAKNCLTGCLNHKACRHGQKCRFNHDFKVAFPKGAKCIKGQCDCN
jgi:hypothetical protein